MLDAIRSLRTAVDGLWEMLQSWPAGRSPSPAPAPGDTAPDPTAARFPSPRGEVDAPATEPSS